MPKLPIKQSLFIFANIFLILSFFMEKKWPLISLLNEYMKNLVIPFLTIIITIQLSRENRQMAGDNRQLVGDDLENRPLAQENLQINGDIENSQLARNDYQIEGQNDPLAGDNHQLGGENPQLAGENTIPLEIMQMIPMKILTFWQKERTASMKNLNLDKLIMFPLQIVIILVK